MEKGAVSPSDIKVQVQNGTQEPPKTKAQLKAERREKQGLLPMQILLLFYCLISLQVYTHCARNGLLSDNSEYTFALPEYTMWSTRMPV